MSYIPGAGSGAPSDATYITQTANGSLSAEQALSLLATGLVKVETGTGVLSTAVAGDLPSHTHAQADVTNLTTDLAAKQPDVQFKDEGVNAGTSGGVTVVDFVGAGVSAAEAAGTLTVTIAGGASTNAFGTIAVSGQSNVVADAAPDKLTLIAGTNVTITTDATGDSVTINSTGGGIADGATLAVGLTFPNTGLHLLDTNATHDLILKPGSDLTVDRTLTLTTGDLDRTLTIAGDGSIVGTNTGDITLAGTPDYITLSGQAITRGQIDLTTDVTGVLPHGNLGTGGGGATKFLREDNTFQAIAGGGDVVGDDVSTTVQNIVAYNAVGGKNITELTGTQGDVLYHNGTNWAKLGFGTSGHFLKTQGTGANPAWSAVQSATFAGSKDDNFSAPSSATIFLIR